MLSGLRQAAGSIAKGKVDACILCGVDSLVNRSDIQWLAGAERLYDRGNPNGVIPGEAAAAVLVTVPGQADRPLARIHGLGLSAEPHSVLGSKYSQGRGLEAALAAALEEAGMPESIVGFRVSDMNGDRYRVWEALFAQARFYRTWRAHLPSWYFTASVGDVGAATGALALVLAATGIFRRYAPAQWGMCECSSEEGLRGACLVGPAEV